MSFVEKTVDVKEIKQIKVTKCTLTTNYEVITQTPQGIKTVIIVTNNNNATDITLIDVKSEIKVSVESYTTVVIDTINVKDTTTNDITMISVNKYLKLVSEDSVSKSIDEWTLLYKESENSVGKINVSCKTLEVLRLRSTASEISVGCPIEMPQLQESILEAYLYELI